MLVDKQGRLAYRGAVSDRYGLGVSYDHPRHAYLDDALAALAAGNRPAVASTSSPGCALKIPTGPAAATTVTWHGRVQHLMQDRCMRCHREGGVAPFGLETYEQVKDHAGMVSMTVRKKIMPPWFASRNSGPFLNDASLSPDEKRDLAAWVKAGTPKGDPARAPKKKAWPGRWSIGRPDQVFELPRPVQVKAEGRMDYVNVQLETNLEQDRWVKAWEVKPTARDVVHHVLVFALRPGQKRVPGGERGDFFAAFVPGNGSAIYPEGVAKKLPKGMTLHFQLHYTPNGRAARDRTRLGVIFAKNPRHEVVTGGIANMRIKIPAGASDHEEFAGVPVPFDAVVLSLMPHMHYRGKAFRYVLLSPKNERTPLLEVPRYDFNWQLAYRFAQPRKVKRGSRIVVFARFDNSKDNPANPDPTRAVRWGDQSDDEMLIGYLEYYVPSIPAGEKVPRLRGTRAQRLWAMLDRDLDGKVSLQECPPRLRPAFHGLDKNGDGSCTLKELEPVNRR